MRAAVIKSPLNIQIEDTRKPEIKEGQILVKNEFSSICGSDAPFFLNERPMQYPLPPGVPGHECIGVIAETRSKLFKEGDIVLSIPENDTGFAEYFVSYPHKTLNIPSLDGNLVVVQPLGTIIHACRKLFQPILSVSHPINFDEWDLTGKKVAIVGLGSIGLLFTALFRLLKADVIIGIDPINYRLEVAKRMGADYVSSICGNDAIEMVSRITDGDMVDLAVEAVGKTSTLNDCINITKRNGTVIAFGVPRRLIYDLPFWDIFHKEIKLITSVGPDVQSEFPKSVELVLNNIDTSPIITHRLLFDDIQTAFELFTSRRDNVIKVLMKF